MSIILIPCLKFLINLVIVCATINISFYIIAISYSILVAFLFDFLYGVKSKTLDNPKRKWWWKLKTEGTCPLVFCIFVVIFVFGFLVSGHFYLGFYGFEVICEKKFLQKAHFFWPFGHFCFKSGQPAKPVFMRVPGVCGHFPTFFFNLLLLKNNNIIYNWQIKVGFWPQQYLVQNFAKNTCAIMKRIRIGD